MAMRRALLTAGRQILGEPARLAAGVPGMLTVPTREYARGVVRKRSSRKVVSVWVYCTSGERGSLCVCVHPCRGFFFPPPLSHQPMGELWAVL